MKNINKLEEKLTSENNESNPQGQDSYANKSIEKRKESTNASKLES